MSTRPRIVDVDAGNDATPGPGHHGTSLGVEGEGFTPGGEARFVVTGAGGGGRPLAQGSAAVNEKGFAQWSAMVRPALACGDSVFAVGTDVSSGTKTEEASTEVFCPGDPV